MRKALLSRRSGVRDARSRWSALILVFAVAASLAACASPASGAHQPSASSKPAATSKHAKIFDGTPDEYSTVLQACMQQHGLTTVPDPTEPGAFSINPPAGMTAQQALPIVNKCHKTVGAEPLAHLSADQLKASYQARVDQWACLVKAGLASGAPKSYDVFLSDYQRSNGKTLWEPTDGLKGLVKNGVDEGPSDVCPRVGTAW